MLKTDKINLAGILILLAGELLILLGFYMFKNIFVVQGIIYLDFLIISLVYFLLFLNIFRLFIPVKDFEYIAGGLGINWFFLAGWSLLSVLGVITGVTLFLSLKLQLLYQFSFLFLFAVGVYSSRKSSEYATNVTGEQQESRIPIINIQNLINQIQIAYSKKNLNWETEQKLLEELAEKCRSISPSNSMTAKDLEAEIISELEILMSQFIGIEPSREVVTNSLINCDNLIKHRKKLYSN